MAYNGVAKVQHYVPQFLLRNFCDGKTDQLFVFDKRDSRSFRTNVKNIASESRFYNFEVDGREFSLEPGLSKVEGKAHPVFQRILDADSIAGLSSQDRAVICVFLAVQFIRTRQVKEQFLSLATQLRDWMRGFARNEVELKAIEDYAQIPDDNTRSLQIARLVTEGTREIWHHFANKGWVLLKTDAATPFQIGDHPLALQNMKDMAPYGNLGLGVPGIEIYFPLTPTRALGFWCPSLVRQFEEGVKNLEFLQRTAPHALDKVRDKNGIRATWAAIRQGTPLDYKPDNTENFNSLQVRFAERYVMSVREDFDLARRMIADNASVRNGIRPQVG